MSMDRYGMLRSVPASELLPRVSNRLRDPERDPSLQLMAPPSNNHYFAIRIWPALIMCLVFPPLIYYHSDWPSALTYSSLRTTVTSGLQSLNWAGDASYWSKTLVEFDGELPLTETYSLDDTRLLQRHLNISRLARAMIKEEREFIQIECPVMISQDRSSGSSTDSAAAPHLKIEYYHCSPSSAIGSTLQDAARIKRALLTPERSKDRIQQHTKLLGILILFPVLFLKWCIYTPCGQPQDAGQGRGKLSYLIWFFWNDSLRIPTRPWGMIWWLASWPNFFRRMKLLPPVVESRDSPKNAKFVADFDCKVCMDAKIDTRLDPCGHLVCCDACAQKLQCSQCQQRHCPICRINVEAVQPVFVS